MVYVEARASGGFLIWEIQLVKKGSLYTGYIDIYWLGPSLPGEEDANLEDNPEAGQCFLPEKREGSRTHREAGVGRQWLCCMPAVLLREGDDKRNQVWIFLRVLGGMEFY